MPIMYETVGPADTVDHIVPLSRGGARTNWLNTVACCGGGPRSRSARKGNRPLAEARLRLRSTPRVPTWTEVYGSAPPR
jgi:5-methylcytosine-specific restriction endonuclease McrA